jgi:hypothetical protein
MVTPSIGFPRAVTPTPPNPAGTTAPPGGGTSEAQEALASVPAVNSGTSAGNLRTQQNAQILQASMDVSIQSGNASLTLLYRTAIDRINEFLAPEFGPNAIATAEAPDNTPEATAARILSLSTAFYDAFAAQGKNKDKSPDALAQEFVDLIRGGFERGFGEAKDILSGLNVLGEDSPIEQGINQTYALVMKGYDDFLAGKLASATSPNPPAQNDSKDASAA